MNAAWLNSMIRSTIPVYTPPFLPSSLCQQMTRTLRVLERHPVSRDVARFSPAGFRYPPHAAHHKTRGSRANRHLVFCSIQRTSHTLSSAHYTQFLFLLRGGKSPPCAAFPSKAGSLRRHPPLLGAGILCCLPPNPRSWKIRSSHRVKSSSVSPCSPWTLINKKPRREAGCAATSKPIYSAIPLMVS